MGVIQTAAHVSPEDDEARPRVAPGSGQGTKEETSIIPQSVPPGDRLLLPQHQALVDGSGISPEVAAARGYWTATRKAELRDLGFGEAQARVPALVIPIHNVIGELALYQLRPDVPRIKDAKGLKYETPLKARMLLDVPPPARGLIGNPKFPLFVTEGIRKADAAVSRGLCCVALLGVWNWRGSNEDGGKVALPDWESVALNDRHIYIVFDNDVMLKPEVHGALTRLKSFLESRGGKVALVYLPAGDAAGKVGLDDYLVAGHTVDDLLALASPTPRPMPAEDEGESTRNLKGQAIRLEDPEPWPDPVDGAELLDAITNILTRYVVLPDGAAELVAVWVLHTYTMSAWEHTGYLAVVSPARRCGKTTLLRIIFTLAYRALTADDVAPATLFRVIDASRPTLLIDEVDRYSRDSDIWSIINSGHTRGGAVLRCVGDDHEPRAFPTWSAKVMAYIRASRTNVPDTVEDRCIRLRLQRRAVGEVRAKLRSRDLDREAAPVRRQLMRWANDQASSLAKARPEIPGDLDDRAADSWEPLLAVADAVGGRWPELARRLAITYSTERAEDERESYALVLVSDILSMLDGDLEPTPIDPPGGTWVSAADVVRLLKELPDRPWKTWPRGQGSGISETALGLQLRSLGVRSETVGPASSRRKRYSVEKLRDLGTRYAPPVRVAETLTPSHKPETAPVSDGRIRGCEGVRVEPSHTREAEGTNPHTRCTRCGSSDESRIYSTVGDDLVCSTCRKTPPEPEVRL